MLLTLALYWDIPPSDRGRFLRCLWIPAFAGMTTWLAAPFPNRAIIRSNVPILRMRSDAKRRAAASFVRAVLRLRQYLIAQREYLNAGRRNELKQALLRLRFDIHLL